MGYRDRPSDPVDRSTFAELLDQLASRARAHDVDLVGSYDLRTPQRDQPDYTVEITRITKE